MTMGGNTIRFERGAPLDLRAALVAATQHGTVSAAQLRQCGLSASAIGRRLQAGRLHRLHRGVYVPGHRRLPPLGWAAAAVLACGLGASASHLTAGGLHALRLDSRTLIDVAVSSACRHAHARVVTHSARNLRPHDVTVVDGIPVTSPARTLLDCAPVVGPADTAKLVAVAERLGIFDLAAVEDLLLHVRGHRGRRSCARQLPMSPGRAATRNPLTRTGCWRPSGQPGCPSPPATTRSSCPTAPS